MLSQPGSATVLSDEDGAQPDPDPERSISITRFPTPSKERYVQLDAVLDTAFVVGTEFGAVSRLDDSDKWVI
ncbi:MAG: hypothetical protein GY910_01945 [bacterium]|nr:hypothetical protein [bacterium]